MHWLAPGFSCVVTRWTAERLPAPFTRKQLYPSRIQAPLIVLRVTFRKELSVGWRGMSHDVATLQPHNRSNGHPWPARTSAPSRWQKCNASLGGGAGNCHLLWVWRLSSYRAKTTGDQCHAMLRSVMRLRLMTWCVITYVEGVFRQIAKKSLQSVRPYT
jgi:hypothetical protein